MVSKQIEKLYREEKAKMLSYVRSHTQDPVHDAEDLVQDVMLKMFRLMNMNTKIENLAAYAWRSLKNLIIDKHRRRSAQYFEQTLEKHREPISTERSPEDQMLKEHFHDYLEKALAALKPSERALWIATEIDGIPYQELAEMWDEPIGTLLSRKCRSEKKILEILNTYYKETSYEMRNG